MFTFSINTRNTINEVNNLFQYLPRNVRGVAAEAASDDLIGTPQRGLQRYPPYRHITRAAAFRPPYQSDRHRRFVMAGIRGGSIDPGFPHRTGNYQRSWVRIGNGVNSRVSGTLPHEGWPNALAKKIGWRDPMDIIESNMVHASQAAERAVARYMAEKGWA
jgi:hypothetical protein